MMFYELPMVNLSGSEMLEKARVRELVEYDRYCNDYRLKDRQAELWFDDGMVFTTWFKGSYKDFKTASPTRPENESLFNPPSIPGLGVMVQHRPCTTVVWLNGERAVAEILFQLCFRTPLGDDWVDIECWARMHYRCEKREGKWGIVYMEGIYEKDRLDPLFADSGYCVPREELMKYRPINWNMGYRRANFEGGADYAEDWAGADRPESIEKLYRDSSDFIFSK